MAKNIAVRNPQGRKQMFGPNKPKQRNRGGNAKRLAKLSDSKKDGQRAEKPVQKVLMANPRKKFGRNKRHANPDVSDDDSLPSESDEADSDVDTAPRKSKKQKTSKGDDDDDSDVEQFLNEEEEEGQHVQEITKASDSTSEDDDDEEEPDEEMEAETQTKRVTASMVAEWRKSVQTQPNQANFKVLTRAFVAAVGQITDKQTKMYEYKIEGGPVFNSVVTSCLRCVGPALSKLLRISATARPKEQIAALKRNKKWKSLHVVVRSYLTSLTELAVRLHEVNIVRRVLQHITDLLPYYSCNPKASKELFKHLIQLWSTGNDKLRLPAFMALLKFLKSNTNEWILPAIKKMYVAYVTNSKVTSSTTWPTISFMAASLVEVLSLNPEVTYQQAFVYIRQMAIHVRNATNQKSKETQAKVYNWPFMHCIYLWCKLLGDVHPSPVLSGLIHPLVQVITSTIRVNPVRKYYPMMFHCVRAMNILSAKANVFIPIIPLLLPALRVNDLNKKPKVVSMKPFDSMTMLKFSESQLAESNYTGGVVDQVFELLCDHLRAQSCKVAFPELVVVLTVQLRQLVKTCKVGEICRKFKQLIGVIEEHSAFITARRRQANLKFTDVAAVVEWEKTLESKDSPFLTYYTSWKKAKTKAASNVTAALSGFPRKEDAKLSDEEDQDEELDEADFWADSEVVKDDDEDDKKVTRGTEEEEEDKVMAMGQLSDEEEENDEDDDMKSD
ncbi:hypothetical protein RvY_17677 [Ramazzottius varieornatus]|uniref:Uncharacterized protein n=1 Tax=Ramazzottius varieornatus TaxID=947166 RepID=A0A1D1W304_RAMVA|nr:hypothetical protein RvY_17677 [Ramazzottius varieornatus]